MQVATVILVLVALAGAVLAEERNDREPLERKRRLAPMRELRTVPERGGGLSDRDDSADGKDEQLSPKHDRSEGRGGRSRQDDDEDD
jgi:hypothetical protein